MGIPGDGGVASDYWEVMVQDIKIGYMGRSVPAAAASRMKDLLGLAR